ncbi:MAG: cell division protein ZapD [Gammaproteobacteria bacterium]
MKPYNSLHQREVSTYINYEQPLNERIRTFLRLEFLFEQIDHCLDRMTQSDMRMSISYLIDIVDLIGRTDVKNEVIKELEKYGKNLENFQTRSGVDSDRLDSILDDIRSSLDQLRNSRMLPGQTLRNDEFISFIKQRNNIPGGTCSFDLPSYHHWLNQKQELHNEQFNYWMKDLIAFKNGIFLILHIIRNSSNPSLENAENGFFQKSLETGTKCQMIRVVLANNSPYYPEISGGKHRFTIRFMHRPDLASRPIPATETIEFKLYCCTL